MSKLEFAKKIYLEKAAGKARGKLGEAISVDEEYYYDSIAKFKKCLEP